MWPAAIVFSAVEKLRKLAISSRRKWQMSYNERRRDPRTRGGVQRGRMLDKISSRYARSDNNVFRASGTGTGTGSESELLQSSDTNSENEQSNETFVLLLGSRKRGNLTVLVAPVRNP